MTLNWYLMARKKLLEGAINFCSIPEKYFSVLKQWGYVEGTPQRAVMGTRRPPEEWLEDKRK